MCQQLCEEAAPQWPREDARRKTRGSGVPFAPTNLPDRQRREAKRNAIEGEREPPGCESSWPPGWRKGMWLWSEQPRHSALWWPGHVMDTFSLFSFYRNGIQKFKISLYNDVHRYLLSLFQHLVVYMFFFIPIFMYYFQHLWSHFLNTFFCFFKEMKDLLFVFQMVTFTPMTDWYQAAVVRVATHLLTTIYCL